MTWPCKMMTIFSFFLILKIFQTIWHIVVLQCCVSFCYTEKWFSYAYVILSFLKIFSSIMACHRILNSDPCATQQDLYRSYFTHSLYWYNSLHLLIPDLEKAMAPHSSTLAWKIPWMEEPDGLQSMGSLGVWHDWTTSLSLFTFMHWRRKWQPTPVSLPGESQGRWSLVGCRLWGRTESDTTEAT